VKQSRLQDQYFICKHDLLQHTIELLEPCSPLHLLKKALRWLLFVLHAFILSI